MPSNNSKYATEMREQTAAYIIENHKSATSMAEEMGIDCGQNTATNAMNLV